MKRKKDGEKVEITVLHLWYANYVVRKAGFKLCHLERRINIMIEITAIVTFGKVKLST